MRMSTNSEKIIKPVNLNKKLIGINREKNEIINLFNNVTKEYTNDQAKILAEELAIRYIKKRFEPIVIHGNGNQKEIWIKENGIYRNVGETKIDEYLGYIYFEVYTLGIKKRIIHKITSRVYKEQSTFFDRTNIFQIPMQNGVFDLSSKSLLKYEDTNSYFFNAIGIDYDSKASCPNFLNFLEEVLENGKEDIDTMQEVLGNIIIGDYRFQKAVIILGTGGNGKGTFLNVIQKVFMGVTSNLDLSQITKKSGDNFEIATLFGKWLNISGDIGKKDFLQDTGTFKKLTGQDYIEAQRKRLGSINFKNRAKLFLACNELPHTQDASDGFFRRWIAFRFDKKFLDEPQKPDGKLIEVDKLKNIKKPNVNLFNELTTPNELKGIIKWIIDGAIRLLENKEFSPSKTNENLNEFWKMNSNPLEMFCEKHIDIEDECYVSQKEFRDRLYKFNPNITTTAEKIRYYLKERFNVREGKAKVGDNRVMVWRGISFIDEDISNGKNVFEEDEQ